MQKDSVQLFSITPTGRMTCWNCNIFAEYSEDESIPLFTLDKTRRDFDISKFNIMEGLSSIVPLEGPYAGKHFVI